MSTQDPNDLLDSIEQQTPDDHTPLAEDLEASITNLAAEVDLSGSGPNPMPIRPEMGLEFLKPMIKTKATDEPETALRTLALIHLETGALLDKHTTTDPVDLLE